MAMFEKEGRLGYVPTEEHSLYPETDGKPMAASDEHRRVLIGILRGLESFFRDTPDVYVSGDILMYYVQGDPRRVVSPDVLVTFGIGRKARRTYQVWVEGKPPDFVMELSSKTTYQRDLTEKLDLYAGLGVSEYFLADIEGLYLPSPLMGFRLVAGQYQAVSPDAVGSIHALSLGLDVHCVDGDLQFYDPVKDEWLQLPEVVAETRAEEATVRAEEATARAEAESLARQEATVRAQAAESLARQEAMARAEAESENARLRAELARLRGTRSNS